MKKTFLKVRYGARRKILNAIDGFRSRSYGTNVEEMVFYNNVRPQPLTREEKAEVFEKWEGTTPHLKRGFEAFACFKHFNGFDSRYLPHSWYYPYILDKLNPMHFAHAMENKAMMYNYLQEMELPEIVFFRINNSFFKDTGIIISKQQAYQTLLDYPNDCIVKPAQDSTWGRGIQIIKADGKTQAKLETLLRDYSGDFIVQERVRQSTEVQLLNNSSLNTMRITTLLLNGHVSVCSAAIRCGKSGSIVDNVGAGGAIIGINEDGSLHKYGFNHEGATTKNGDFVFEGFSIPNYNKVIEFALTAHSFIPNIRLAGWDICLDISNHPKLIEVNTSWPGIFYEQLCTGPIFGERTDEVIDFCKTTRENTKSYRFHLGLNL